MLQGIACIQVSCDPVVWTLSIEFCFYVMAPIFARTKPAVLLAFAAASFALHVAVATSRIPMQYTFLYGFDHAEYLWPWLLGFIFYRDKTTLNVMPFGYSRHDGDVDRPGDVCGVGHSWPSGDGLA